MKTTEERVVYLQQRLYDCQERAVALMIRRAEWEGVQQQCRELLEMVKQIKQALAEKDTN